MNPQLTFVVLLTDLNHAEELARELPAGTMLTYYPERNLILPEHIPLLKRILNDALPPGKFVPA